MQRQKFLVERYMWDVPAEFFKGRAFWGTGTV